MANRNLSQKGFFEKYIGKVPKFTMLFLCGDDIQVLAVLDLQDLDAVRAMLSALNMVYEEDNRKLHDKYDIVLILLRKNLPLFLMSLFICEVLEVHSEEELEEKESSQESINGQ